MRWSTWGKPISGSILMITWRSLSIHMVSLLKWTLVHAWTLVDFRMSSQWSTEPTSNPLFSAPLPIVVLHYGRFILRHELICAVSYIYFIYSTPDFLLHHSHVVVTVHIHHNHASHIMFGCVGCVGCSMYGPLGYILTHMLCHPFFSFRQTSYINRTINDIIKMQTITGAIDVAWHMGTR